MRTATAALLVLLLTLPAFADFKIPDGWKQADRPGAVVLYSADEQASIVLSGEKQVKTTFRAWFDSALKTLNATSTVVQSDAIVEGQASGYDYLTCRQLVVSASQAVSYRRYVAIHKAGRVQLLGYIATREDVFDKHAAALAQLLGSWSLPGEPPLGPIALEPAKPAGKPAEIRLDVQEIRLAYWEAVRLQQQGQIQKALDAFQSCRERARKASAPEEELQAASSAQTCLVILGRFEDALALGKDVLSKIDPQRQPLLAARAHQALANAQRGLLQYERALREAREALRAADAFGASLDATGKSPQEVVDLCNGAEEVRRLYLDSAWLLELLGRSEEIVSIFEGPAYTTLGKRIDAARAPLADALRQLFAEPLAVAFLEAYRAMSAYDAFEGHLALARACATLAQETRDDAMRAKAAAALEEARAMADRGLPFVEVHRAIVYMALGDLLKPAKEARKPYETALKLSEKAPAVVKAELQIEILAGLVETSLAPDPQAAAAQLARAEALAKDRAALDPTLPWRMLDLRGRVLERQGRLPEAAEAYRAAVRLIEQERGGIETAELKEKFFRSRQRVYENLIRVLHGIGRDEEAMLTMERVRARNLLDLLGGVAVTKGVPKPLQQRLADTRKAEVARLVDANRRHGGERSAVAPPPAASDLRARTFDDILREAPELADLKGGEPQTPAQVAALLDDETVLLEYMVGEGDASVAVLKKGAAPRLVPLATSGPALRRLVNELRLRVQKPGNDRWREPAEALREALLGPVEADLAKRVVVLPYDRLNHLPWTLLLDGHDVVVLPSASVLKFCREKKRGPRERMTVFALGNVASEGLPALPATLGEASALTKLYPSARLLSEGRFTVASIREAAPGQGLVHFATHGVLDASIPEASSVITADGALPVRDIVNLDLSADLVVLSACETGLGRVYSGDEVVGLTRAFMYAGTPSVLATLWKVSDESTARFMAFYYEALKSGDKAAALRTAQQRLREQYPHPYYWAPFVLMGDWL